MRDSNTIWQHIEVFSQRTKISRLLLTMQVMEEVVLHYGAKDSSVSDDLSQKFSTVSLASNQKTVGNCGMCSSACEKRKYTPNRTSWQRVEVFSEGTKTNFKLLQTTRLLQETVFHEWAKWWKIAIVSNNSRAPVRTEQGCNSFSLLYAHGNRSHS